MWPHSTLSLKRILFLLCSCLLFLPIEGTAGSSLSNGPPVPPAGDSQGAKLLTTGVLSLYKYVTEGPAVPFQESYAPDTARKTEWYLLQENTEQKMEVTRFNYRTVLRLMFRGRPDLVQKLGRKGYRFEDMQAMVAEYNGKKR